MCTYLTETFAVAGSAKGPQEWLRVTDASVYYDHPAHALGDHTVNIDLRRPADGPQARIAVELSAESARALAESILSVLAAAPH